MKHTIYGIHAVQHALDNPTRTLHKLVTTKSGGEHLRIPSHISHEIVESTAINKVTGADAVHQGTLLYCDPLPQPNLHNLLQHLHTLARQTLVMLDNLTDPQNIGAIIRTCAAFHVKGIICHAHQTPDTETPSLVKAACGAIEHIPIVRVGNLSKAQEQLKSHDYWCLGLSEHARTRLDQVPDYDKCVIVMGSEGKGIRPQVMKGCDITAFLSTNPDFPTLNVSAATAVTLATLSLGRK